MRICLISGEFPPMQGGVGDYTQELGAAMVQAGHQVIVLTSCRAEGPEWRRGCRILPIVARWSWRIWPLVTDFVRREQPDVLNIQYQTAAYGMNPAINLLPIWTRFWKPRPIIVTTFHDLLVPFLFRGAGPLREAVNARLIADSDGVIATNEEDAARIRRRFPVQRATLIPIGPNVMPGRLDSYNRVAWRARWGIADSQFLLSYFGFLNQSKGGEELIQALAILAQRGRDVRLIMVGGKVGASDPTNAGYLAHVEQLIAQLGLRDRVAWTDYLPKDQVTATLLASDVCVLPYRDGASTRRGTLMAALAHGLPIVTTTPSVPIEYFRDGENMVFVPARNPSALADAIERLADDPALRERLREGARELAGRFTWSSIAEATVGFYYRLGAS